MNETLALPARHKIDVEAYHRMGEVGIFADDARIELIDGELIDMAPIGQGHAVTVNRLNETLILTAAGRAIVSVQNPVRLDRYSEPQPDIALLRRREDFYEGKVPPGPGDVLLLIEVSETTLRFDRAVKLPLYARAGIGEYWIIDRPRRIVQVHRRPSETGYEDVFTKGPGDRLALAMDPAIVIDLDRVFG